MPYTDQITKIAPSVRTEFWVTILDKFHALRWEKGAWIVSSSWEKLKLIDEHNVYIYKYCIIQDGSKIILVSLYNI